MFVPGTNAYGVIGATSDIATGAESLSEAATPGSGTTPEVTTQAKAATPEATTLGSDRGPHQKKSR